MKTIELNVDGMSCKNCVNSVTNAVKSLKSVTDCHVDLTTKKAKVTFDENILSVQDIIEKIEDIGFEAYR